MTEDFSKPLSPEELASLPTVYRDDLFAGQVVLVTGGAGGIGLATCILFGRLGATIVSCSRTAEKMQGLEETLGGLGIESFTRPLSIRDPEAVAEFTSEVFERFGRLDVLVNNAGGQFASPALEISPGGWQAVVDLNLNGTWYMMQAAAKGWCELEQPGNIVTIVAIPRMCMPGIAHSMAARAGQIQATRSLSVEWGPHGIRVNAVAVGAVASPGLANYPDEALPSMVHNPQRRIGSVQDIAEACVYLAGPSGNFVNGAILNVDGGAENFGEFWPLGRPDYFRFDY